MIFKKILLPLLTFVLVAISTSAQSAVGDWRLHTSFVGSEVLAVAETEDWVYYLTGGTPRIIYDDEGHPHSIHVIEGDLFRLDKQTDENEALSLVNGLSDMVIEQIHYNSEKDYLVVVYSNSNIDIIKSDGSVVNMPEIKNVVMTMSKGINDVTFADGLIYLATDFGYAVIDDRKFVFKESHLYGKAVISAAQLGNQLLLSTADGIYYGDASKYHEQLSSFSIDKAKTNSRIFPLKNNKFLRVTSKTRLVTMKVNDQAQVSFTEEDIIMDKATLIQKTAGGYLLSVPTSGRCYKTDDEGKIIDEFETTELCSAYPGGDGKPWACGEKGLHLLGQENYYLPNALSFSSALWMTYNKGKDMLYVSTPTANAYYKAMRMQSQINTYDGIQWKDVTPEGAPQAGTYWIDFLPGDDNTYFIGGWTTGLYKVVDNKIVMNYNEENSPLVKYGGAMHPITSIDRNGNLWVVQSFENPEHPVMVLPAAKTKLNETTAADWVFPKIEGIYTGHTQRASFLSTRNSKFDIKMFTDGDYQMPIVFWNSDGAVSTPSQRASYTKILDQDGQYISWTNIMCLAEDLTGLVWMGTSEGIVSFNPGLAFSPEFRVNHIKVPRNDGTGMADYLLDGIQVNGIAVDGANRKWIATQTSGLFLVSADGTQVIKRFNSTNSPLASNTVFRVCCNPNSNSVYITTPEGLYEYFSDSSPAESNYSNIFAYPNPVRPEFTGNVTITGMMDNSLVKIADASGNVLCQLKSVGGMATWDCCNQWGEPVKTGVYLVLCSRAGGGSESVVTKIAVIR